MYVGKKTLPDSSRKYIACNFTDVIVIHNHTMNNVSGMQKSAANKMLQKINIPMPMNGLIDATAMKLHSPIVTNFNQFMRNANYRYRKKHNTIIVIVEQC